MLSVDAMSVCIELRMKKTVSEVAHHAAADNGNLDGGKIGEEVFEAIEQK